MKLIYLFLVISFFTSSAQNSNELLINELKYEVFENDPTGLRLYTLKNGLKVYLSQNRDVPKIETLIAVKAGSTYDPIEQTGLAHYLEHMLFKGTSNIGTQDWEKEKILLNRISDLYELHKKEKDTLKKQILYRKIDSASNKAANYAIANEYDKMISSIGAEGTNAFTSNEMTVYKNKIPSNGLDKWLLVEKERFSQLVLRLFHTELETVYEEYNRGQDSDGRKQYTALLQQLFPTHPYGTKTTIGTAEHLKNPSMEAIHEYFNKYYVPNNMAVILVGDIDYNETIKKVNKAFGNYNYKEVVHPKSPIEKPITSPIEKTVYGPSASSVYIGYRTENATSDQAIIINLIDYMLANSTAGLIDLNLNAQQKVQSASSFISFKKDYGMHVLSGSPRKNQSLDEVKQLLISQIELIKKGEFDDWLIEAIIKDIKLSKIQSYESIKSTAFEYMYSFVYNEPWEDRLNSLSKMEKITKKQVVDFANDFYKDNYVVIKKEVGEDPNQVKVSNPKITPVKVNREQASNFTTNFNKIHSPQLKVQTVDFEKIIEKDILKNKIQFSSIKNKTNDLASLQIKFPIGNDHDLDLNLAFSYLEYLGSTSFSNEEIKKEFYKLGVSYGFSVNNEETYISLSGLQENLYEGLSLLLDYLQNVKVDKIAYNKLVLSIEKSRSDLLKNKSAILWKGLTSYSKYGENSRLRNTKTIESLKLLNPNILINKIKNLLDFKPEIFYYGNNSGKTKTYVEKEYPKNTFKPNPNLKFEYREKETLGNVYFVNYDIVQAELLLISKEEIYDPEMIALSLLFNNYFGNGLSSIVFQELRESKSLAYSAMSKYSMATKKEKPNYLFAYMGTQANKLEEAVKAMKVLLNEMPLNETQFKAAKASVLKTIAASRITKSGAFGEYRRLKEVGLEKDNRAEIYSQLQKISLTDLNYFFENHIKNSFFDLIIIGNEKDIDFSLLNQFGQVKEFTSEYLFNY